MYKKGVLEKYYNKSIFSFILSPVVAQSEGFTSETCIKPEALSQDNTGIDASISEPLVTHKNSASEGKLLRSGVFHKQLRHAGIKGHMGVLFGLRCTGLHIKRETEESVVNRKNR